MTRRYQAILCILLALCLLLGPAAYASELEPPADPAAADAANDNPAPEGDPDGQADDKSHDGDDGTGDEPQNPGNDDPGTTPGSDEAVRAESVALDVAALSTMYKGETRQLNATVSPAGAEQAVLWSSSNAGVLSVEDGLLTALKTGSAIVTATSLDGNASRMVTIRVAAGSGPSTYQPPASGGRPQMNYSSPNGNNYSWRPGGLYFTADADKLFIDYFQYHLQHPLRTVNGVIFASLDDLRTIYAPDFTVVEDGDKLDIDHAGVRATVQPGSTAMSYYGGAHTLEAAPFEADGTVFLPLFDIMVTGFGKSRSEIAPYYGLGNSEGFAVSSADVYNLKMFYRGKHVGMSYHTYWNESVQRLESVVVYIPTGYDENTPSRMVVQLHGASGNATSIPGGAYGPSIMKIAEQQDYIMMWPGGYVALGNFGNWVPPYGQIPITEHTDPDNPGGYSAGQLADIELSGQNVQVAMDFVMENWNIDERSVFCMGISMGGCGTWYQGAFYGERFAALSPSGAFVEPEYFPWERVTTPTLYVGGTEDRNGFDLMLDAHEYALEQGANIVEFVSVGGAGHGAEWPEALEETFAFFDRYAG